MDKIFLRDLYIDTIIGVYEWERNTHQTLRFDLEMDFDIRPAARSDAINDTLDYGAISQDIVSFVENSRYQLIETLAETLAEHLLSRFAIPRLKMTLTKPVALHGHNRAQIVIERSQP